MNLNEGAEVVYAGQADVEPGIDDEGKEVFMPLGEIVIITDKGTGKRVVASEFAPMRRNRKGLRIIDIYGEKTKVIFACKVLEPYRLVLIGDGGEELNVIDTEDIRIEKKDTKGKPIMRGVTFDRVIRHTEEI